MMVKKERKEIIVRLTKWEAQQLVSWMNKMCKVEEIVNGDDTLDRRIVKLLVDAVKAELRGEQHE